MLNDLYRRGLKGDRLLLVLIDQCLGLVTAIQTMCPRAAHPRSWVHRIGNILEEVRKRDYDAVKNDAQAICLADGCRARSLPSRAQRAPIDGKATRARSARTAGLLPLPKTPMAQAAHRQHHRTPLRRSHTKNPPSGLLRKRAVRGSNHLLHLPEIQPGMKSPHPQRCYTSGLMSPARA